MVAKRHALYERVRAHGPLYVHDSIVLVPGYREVKDVLLDSEHFHNGLGVRGSDVEHARQLLPHEDRMLFDELAVYEAHLIGKLNGEEHRQLRAVVQGAFTPRRIAELETSIDAYLDDLIASTDSGGATEFMTLAYRLPLLVITDFLGFPQTDMELIHDWTMRFMTRYERRHDPVVIRSATDAVKQFCAYVEERLVEHRNGKRPNPLLDAMISGGEVRDMAPIRIAMNCIGFLTAGHETTMTLASGGLVELLRVHETWTELVHDPALIPGAVEELLRLVSPAQWLGRIAQEDATIAGSEIPAGSSVAMLFAAANRDPAVFSDPLRVDPRRGNSRDHFSFAVGPHFCLGAALARLEAVVIFRTLTQRFPDVELAIDVSEVEWAGSSVLPRIRSLPVAFGRDRAA